MEGDDSTTTNTTMATTKDRSSDNVDNRTNRAKRQKITDVVSIPPLFSLLGRDELTYILKFLDEEASIQCELAYGVFHDISRIGTGSGDLHWKELAKYRRHHGTFWPPLSLGFGGEDDFLKSNLYEQKACWWTNTSNQKLKLIYPHSYELDEVNMREMAMTERRYFGIMAAKAREFEQHQWLYHRQDFHYEPDDNGNDEIGASSCNCEDFSMKETNFSLRRRLCSAAGRIVFVALSLRRRELGSEEICINQPFWLGWCDQDRGDDILWSISNESLTGESWSKVHQIQERFRLKEEERAHVGQEVVWTAEEKTEICNKAKEAIGNFRITILSTHGRLIVSTGSSVDDNCRFPYAGRSFVKVFFKTLQTFRDRNTCKGVSVYLIIESNRIAIRFFEKERSRR